jgi:hypothetical protein
VQLKGACPDKRLPKGLLLSGKEAIEDGKSLYLNEIKKHCRNLQQQN